ncbi:MAG: hypothetical protein PHC30_05350 [Lentisphaeria bacterium]|nr:hypothetical protein [Lentisphaeria bacterium]
MPTHKLWLRVILPALLALALLPLAAQDIGFTPIRIPPKYPGHLQGFCADDHALYLAFTSVMVKADYSGKVLLEVPIASHAGDVCLHNGRIYVAHDVRVPKTEAGSFVTVLDTDFKELRRLPLPKTTGPGCIAFLNGSFFIGDDLYGKEPHPLNHVHQYDENFILQKIHTIDIGATQYGVQTMAAFNNELWMGFYMNPRKHGICRFDAGVTFLEGFARPGASEGLCEVPPNRRGSLPRLMVSSNLNETTDGVRRFGTLIRFYEFNGQELVQLQ